MKTLLGVVVLLTSSTMLYAPKNGIDDTRISAHSRGFLAANERLVTFAKRNKLTVYTSGEEGAMMISPRLEMGALDTPYDENDYVLFRINMPDGHGQYYTYDFLREHAGLIFIITDSDGDREWYIEPPVYCPFFDYAGHAAFIKGLFDSCIYQDDEAFMTFVGNFLGSARSYDDKLGGLAYIDSLLRWSGMKDEKWRKVIELLWNENVKKTFSSEGVLSNEYPEPKDYRITWGTKFILSRMDALKYCQNIIDSMIDQACSNNT